MAPLISWVPLVHLLYDISSNLDPLHRPLISVKVLDFRNTPNSLQTGSLSSAHGSVRSALYHTLQGRDPSSRNNTGLKHWHIPLTYNGN